MTIRREPGELPASVLVTGAAGAIGQALRQTLLPKISSVTLSDIKEVAPLATNERFVPADLESLDQVREAVRDAEVVIHLGGISDEASFDVIAGPNLRGAFNVFEACRLEGVERVVYASSNRITGFYPVETALTGSEPVRPDGLYGATKAFGEALASMYADRFGLGVVSVRIGSFERLPSDPRHLSTWLSWDDASRLFEACLRRGPRASAHIVVYGVSNNASGWWPLADGAHTLGYVPQDNAESHASEIAPGERPVGPYQGGEYTAYGYGGWAKPPESEQ